MSADLRQRLAAILAADVAGYSRLMAEDERSTVAALDASRALFRSAIEANRGRVIDMAGDSVLAIFETAAGAVGAALAVQDKLRMLAGDMPEGRRMEYRVGVHLGDVMEKADGTVYGNGVNIAARLQALAEPGGITVSDAIRGAVRASVQAAFEDMGEQTVKNIPEPVRAFRIVVGGEARAPAAAPAAPRAAPPLPEKPSIAVLPFTNMSGDPEQEYFADGMVEDITTTLARTGLFFVIARNSTFVYKGRAVDVKQVGRELGVRYVLEGSVRKAGNRVRITGQLIDVETGRHIWADRFEGTLEDVFDLQDRMTESLVWAIEPNVRRAELDRALAKPTTNLQAYDFLLRSLPGLMPGSSTKEKDEAADYIRRAIEKDPGYSLAKAMGAFALLQRLVDGQGGAEEVKTALRLADEAVADHRDNPATLGFGGLALASLGYRVMGVRVFGFRYEDGLRAVEQALALSPNLLGVLFSAGMVKTYVGEGDAAIPHFDRAIRISPLDPGMSAMVLGRGIAHFVQGRYAEALADGQRAVAERERFANGHRLMAMALAALGRIDEAKAAAKRMLELAPSYSLARYSNLSPLKDADMRKRSLELLRAAGIPE